MNPPEISAPLPQPDPAPPQPAALPLPVPAAPGKEASYTVQPGDSLSLIAVRLFCHEDTWTHIYRLNKEQIAVPHKLQPGMVLRLTGIESRCRSTP
jgi:nucleoid-associated protein YgaU